MRCSAPDRLATFPLLAASRCCRRRGCLPFAQLPPNVPWRRPRRIKEQQQAFQALKKISGNTHTAKGGIANMGVLVLGVVGFLATAKGLYNMQRGINKYPAPAD